jgi:hypothetical protein
MFRFACLAALLAVAACSSQPAIPEARCHAAGAVAELGKPLDDRTKELARMGAGAVRADVVPYRAPAQGGTDPQRLNIEVDQNQVIQRLRCG